MKKIRTKKRGYPNGRDPRQGNHCSGFTFIETLRYLQSERFFLQEQESRQHASWNLQGKHLPGKRLSIIKRQCNPTTWTAAVFPQQSRGLRRCGQNQLLFPSRKIGTALTWTRKSNPTLGEMTTCTSKTEVQPFRRTVRKTYPMPSSVTEQTE